MSVESSLELAGDIFCLVGGGFMCVDVVQNLAVVYDLLLDEKRPTESMFLPLVLNNGALNARISFVVKLITD